MICLLLENVPPTIGEAKLRWLCTFFGKVHSVCFMTHLFTDETNGKAMIQMAEVRDGIGACNALDGWTVDGHRLSAALYPSPWT